MLRDGFRSLLYVDGYQHPAINKIDLTEINTIVNKRRIFPLDLSPFVESQFV